MQGTAAPLTGPAATRPPSRDAEEALLVVLIALGRRMRQQLPGDELDPSAMPVLKTLAECGPVRLTTLAERLHLDASTVSRRVRQLADRGLVLVGSDQEDGRARQVELVPEGAEALDRLYAVRRDLVGRVIHDWPPADRELLRALLDRFHSDLVSQESRP